MAKIPQIQFQFIWVNSLYIIFLTWLVTLCSKLKLDNIEFKEIKDVQIKTKDISLFNINYIFIWTKIIWN